MKHYDFIKISLNNFAMFLNIIINVKANINL
jgi:hypothetical protein